MRGASDGVRGGVMGASDGVRAHVWYVLSRRGR